MANRGFLGRLRTNRGGACAGRAIDADLDAPNNTPSRRAESQWFWDHYEMAAGQVIETFAAEGISLTDRVVADVGCGDGIIDLGILHKARPRRLVGFDLNLTDTAHLAR